MTGVPTSAAPPPQNLATAAADALDLYYIGEAGGIEEELARSAGIPFSPVTTGQIRGRAPWAVARNLVRVARGTLQCGALIQQYRPDAVFVTGGYVTAPLAWAAWRAHVPVLIYLPDVTPGLAIRRMARLANRVAVSFPEVAGYFGSKAVVTGYPVRPELLAVNRDAARQALGLQADLPAVLVFGGSRGARSINRALVAALPALLAQCQVLHVSGQLDWPWVSEAAAGLPANLHDRYHPYPYLHSEMVDALAAADLAVARAGASTLGEFPVVSLPSVLVPYPYAGQHQRANAQYLASRGAALIVEDNHLAARLQPVVLELLAAPEKLSHMARAAGALARPDAASSIARLLCQMAGK